MRKEIEEENENLSATRTELVVIGGKIVNIRTSLLTLNMMLDTVYPSAEESVVELGTSVVSEMLAGQALKPLFQPNTEGNLNSIQPIQHKRKSMRARSTVLITQTNHECSRIYGRKSAKILG